MPDFIYTIPNLTLFLCLVFGLALISCVCVIVIKKYFNQEVLNRNNDVIGFMSATVTLIFAILTGFTTLFLLEHYNKANEIIEKEAATVTSIYHSLATLPKPIRSNIAEKIRNYVQVVVREEWPAMNNGEPIDPKGGSIIENIKIFIINYKTNDDSQAVAMQDLLSQVNILYSTRLTRISMTNTALGFDIWLTLILATILTLVIHYIFSMDLWLHLICAILISSVIASLLFLMIVMDRPFQGSFSIGSKAFTKHTELILSPDAPTTPKA
jgi:hypothetical protein